MDSDRTFYSGADTLRAVLSGWLYGCAMPSNKLSGHEAEMFINLTERNRLDAFIWALLPEGELRDALSEKMHVWQRSYEQSLIRNTQQLRDALHISTLLEGAGIKCIGLRGPFAGVSLYDDVAIRHFTDIDLLIPADMRNKAWDILIEAGFKFSHPFMTRSACIRHHLEWPFRHEEKGISIDLHWAVDHPYKLHRVNYSEIFDDSYIYSCNEGEWRRPSAVHEVLLTAIHAEKECRRKESEYSNQSILVEGTAGLWRHSLDLALLRCNQNEVTDELIIEKSKAWGISASVESALESARTLFTGQTHLHSRAWRAKEENEQGISQVATTLRVVGSAQATRRVAHTSINPVVVSKKEYEQHKSRKSSRIKRGSLARYGVRTECVRDIGRYLLPPASYFPEKHGFGLLCSRIAHIALAICKLFIGVLDFIWLSCRQVCRSLSAGRATIFIIMLFALESFAHDFGDDVSDMASGAETIIVNGGTVQRVLEIDQDEDWYTFLVQPYIDYTVSVSKGSIFDLSLDRFARDGNSLLVATNTLPDYTAATNDWLGGRLLERAYIRVTGMFEFTTGTYNIALSGTMQDTDSDGLPDAWEQYRFTNLMWNATDDPDSDGVNNENEWLLDTGPDNASSRFYVNDISTSGSNMLISWQSSTGGCYMIQWKSNLLDKVNWRTLDANAGSSNEIRYYNEPVTSSNNCLFYRVIYDN